MSELNEKLIAKQAGEDTGIEIKRTICEICSRGCGLDAYVKDGKVIKVEGTKGNPTGFSYLCQKGQGSRSYIYREDRIKTPLRRVGPKASGQFEPISWEEAYTEIAQKLNQIKKESGPDSVVFFTGYTKWYRPLYRRFLYSFGSQNYCTDDSICYYSTFMANMLNSGTPTRPDTRNSGIFLGWAFNKYYSGSIVETKRLEIYKQEHGLKILIIDPRITPAVEKLADMHLRPLPGTDGALAHGFANLFIHWDRIDHDFIDKHVYGFEEYKEYVSQFTVEKVARITGITEEEIIAAAKMLTENGPMSIAESGSPIVHHVNGMQTYRAIMALSAITGNYDRVGGQIPLRFADSTRAGDVAQEDNFAYDTFPYHYVKKVGQKRFPLFCELVEQGQDMDLARHIEEKDPYPIRAIFAMGMNHRMLPANQRLMEAVKTLDFFVDVDIFMTDTAKQADIVLPACSSFERGTFKNYGNGKVAFTKPVIEPLYESKSDADILCELADYLDLKDPLLRSGYKNCMNFVFNGTGLTVEQLQEAGEQVMIPTFVNYKPGLNTATGYATLTEKYELKSKTPGVVFALATAVRSCTEPGDAVLIQPPVYYPFFQVIKDNGRRLVENRLLLRDGRYEIDFADLEEKFRSEQVKLMLLCSPHNPVSRVWAREELERLAALCVRYHVILAADEIHCDFTFPGHPFTSLGTLGPEILAQSLIFTAPSKTFNLAGLQASNVFIPDDALRRGFRREMRGAGYSQLNALGLLACKTAYTQCDEWLEELKNYLNGNLDFLRAYLNEKLPQLRLIEPGGDLPGVD